MISPTQQEHRAARERAKQREPEPQRPAAQRRQEAAARQPHSGHAPAGDDHHPLRKERPAGKSPRVRLNADARRPNVRRLPGCPPPGGMKRAPRRRRTATCSAC
ncbi:Uncharacterised protein [Serratia rubidaea]|uniref:Uncharacterized protein n=1 Tax=Serratia rubidaea TaxID=61652 RepID=A0A3S4HZJ5_SERRU|nr:Uncharacterised protein [Serratia rubidaea]